MKKRLFSMPVLLAALAVTGAGVLPAQEKHAHIGYVYPAGGSRGGSITVTVGGQYLSGARMADISGQGVRARVIKYWKPPSRGQLNQIARMIRELAQRQKAAAGKGSAKKAGGSGKDRPRTTTRGRSRKSKKDKAAKGSKPPPPDPKSFEEIVERVGFKGLTRKEYTAQQLKSRDPKRQPNPQILEEVTLRITIDPDAPLGSRELRLRASQGFSNPIAFHVGQWKELLEKEPNDHKPDARVATYLPTTLNGQIMPGDVDRYSFTAKKGMRLVAVAAARELVPFLADAVPGWFQAVLSLYDEQGRQLAYVDDFLFHPDPVLCFRIPADGRYILEIRDSIYRGREDFVYRISLGEIPYVTHIFPLGGRVGQQSQIRVHGWNLPVTETTLDARDMDPGRTRISIGDGRCFSNRLHFALDDLNECCEIEPNDDSDHAQPIKQDMVVNGRIGRVGDRDVFRFKGYTGKTVVFQVQARRLGSPLDSLLLLTDEEGLIVATNDDYVDRASGLVTHHADSRLECRLPRTGIYLLHLVDIQDKGGDEYAYRLHVSRRQPDFALRVTPSSILAQPGQTVPLTVHALRDDYQGEIRLSLQDKPLGFAMTGAVIPPGADRVRFTLTVPQGAMKEAVNLRIRGQAKVGGRRIRHTAVPAEDRMQAFLWRHLVPTENLFVVVTGKLSLGPPLQRTSTKAVRLHAGGTTRIQYSGAQSAALKGVGLELNSPPKGISLVKVAPRRAGGLILTLKAARGAIKPGVQGNLIFNAFKVYTYGGKNGQPLRTNRVAMGTMPAVPFKVVH